MPQIDLSGGVQSHNFVLYWARKSEVAGYAWSPRMPHRLRRYLFETVCKLKSMSLRRARLLIVGAVWMAAVLPAAAQSVVLDTDGISLPHLGSVLQQAYQLPLLIDAESTPSKRQEALAIEKARLRGVIADFGYLDGDIVEEHQAGKIVLRPKLGDLYRVTSVELKGIRQSELEREVVDRLAAIIEELVGQPSTTFVAETFTRRILQAVSAEDFALAQSYKMEWVRKGTGMVSAVIGVDLGPRTRFGSVQFSGALRMQSELQRLVPFRPGERYSASRVEELRRNLEALQTVKSVNIAIGKDQDGLLPIDVRIREAPANLEALRHTDPIDVGSGLVAMAGLLLVQVGTHAGIVRSRLRPLIWVTTASLFVFALLATLRLASFLA
ncbi:POTRA domain-containing protein [Ensifer sp. 2YAB10]|uniref:POTRA domain-containing protein n=1 Tax=unclassified Ensifer TaxID=2633371 RepID=UPI003F936EA4